jgi:hypothetical protein
VAAEYEVNIKINSQEIETQLGKIDRKIAKIGKPKGGSSRKRSGIAGLLPSSEELRAADRGITQLTARTKSIQNVQDKFSQRRIRALVRSNNLNEKELRINRQLTNEARQRLRLLSQSGAKGFDATRPQGRQMSENINALANAQERRARLANRINEMEAKGLNVSKLRKQLGKATTEQSARRFASATKEFRLLEKTIRLEESKLKILRQQQQGFASSPIRGSATMPGSPLAVQQGMNRLGQVGLGAGFPLLFGGGPGSVIGGGLGGLTGSFGAQIALSAAGQQIDQLISRTVESAESLTSVGTALDFLRERSLFSSKESEQLARKLENQGDLTGIAALVTEELNEALGPDGIQKMQDLAEQTRLAKEQWGQLTTNLELLISGPLTEFLAIVNATLGIKVAQSNFARSLSRLQERDPERLRGLLPSFEGAKDPAKAIASNLAFGPNMAGGVFNMQGLSEGALISFTEQMNSILRSMDPSGGTIPVTEEDKKRFKRKGQARKNKLPGLEAEREKLERLLDLEEKRFEFELKGDRAAIARMEASEKVAKIAEEIKKIKASDLTDEEKRVALAAQGIENARVNLELGFQLAQIDKDRLAQIEELRIKTEEMNPVYQQQLALAEGLADTFGTTMMQAFDAMVAGTERFDVAVRNLVAGALNDMARKLFQIYVIEQLITSIGSAFAPPPIFGSGGGVDRFGRGTLGPNYGISQRALGGAVASGRPYMVGERGPELFVPGAQGNIVPNNAMGSTSVVVNVDASGTEVQGNQGNADQLGRLIGQAVQAELIKQKRPGGLLTR